MSDESDPRRRLLEWVAKQYWEVVAVVPLDESSMDAAQAIAVLPDLVRALGVDSCAAALAARPERDVGGGGAQRRSNMTEFPGHLNLNGWAEWIGPDGAIRNGVRGVVVGVDEEGLVRLDAGHAVWRYPSKELRVCPITLAEARAHQARVDARGINPIDGERARGPERNTDAPPATAESSELGPGIETKDLRPPPRPHRRHQTTSWDPGMPLPDAEPGRYGWLP